MIQRAAPAMEPVDEKMPPLLSSNATAHPAAPEGAPPLSDAELVAACLLDEPSALKTLVERFQGLVWSLCFRLLRDRHEAEDVAQEVFIRILRGLKGWDANRPLHPWIMAIAINRCRTQLAQRARRPRTVDNLNLQPAKPDLGQPSNEWKAEVDAALSMLREEYREVFILFHEQGLPYEDIAALMQRPVGTIKTWLHRARSQMFEQLRERGMIDGMEHDLS